MSVSRETLETLNVFVHLLQTWNARINLIGPVRFADIWPRHIEDSLRLVDLIPIGTTTAIDLGSGAGFPGLVVAIATGIHVDLIESDRRKAAFLAEAIRMTKASATVHATRIETTPCSPAPLLTSRALAPLGRLLALAKPLLSPGGICLFHKGRNVETEIATARKDWTMVIEQFRSEADSSSVILCVSQLAHA